MKTGTLLPPRSKSTGQHAVYYIPFSKQKVDEILENVDKDSVIFTLKFPASVSGGSGIRNNFSYEGFLLPLDEAFKLNAKPGGSSMNNLSAVQAIPSESGIT
jgi:hypothetical protein